MFGRIKVFDKDEFYHKYDKNGYKIVRNYCKKNDVMDKEEVICPVCNSEDIIIQKGDGFKIYGADYIVVICNKCKKVYGFSDVKYKFSCPKEL